MNAEVVKVLNKQVADWNVLFVKLHNFHWFVKGPYFFGLHAKFEELYDEAANYIDEVAERILIIKGVPLATMKEYLEVSTIAEGTGKETPKEMVAAIIADFQAVNKELREGIEITGDAGDDVTQGMLTDMSASLEKHLWMLEAFQA